MPQIASGAKEPIQPSSRATAERRTQIVRRDELRRIVPLADTTIYEMERRGQFPRRFNLTPRCVVWDLTEVEAWIEKQRRISESPNFTRSKFPNVRLRKFRPVRS